jgi:hypothetical protein
VKLTLLPAATLADDGDTAMLKSGPPVVPVPVSAAVCGLLGLLSATLKVAVAAAAAVGVNVTLMVQAAPAARVVPQVVVSANKDADVPPMETAMAFKGEVVLLLRVTIFAGLVVLMDWLPKATVAGVRNMPVGGAVPVPVSETVCGLLGSLSPMVSAAFSVAVVEAVKIISMVQFEPAAKVVVQVEVPTVKSVALAPVNEMVMPVSVAEVLLYKVTVAERHESRRENDTGSRPRRKLGHEAVTIVVAGYGVVDLESVYRSGKVASGNAGDVGVRG